MQEASLEQQVTFLGDFEVTKLSEEDLKKLVLKLQRNYTS
jgi:hypothetical protein